jgi:hypothetical protein
MKLFIKLSLFFIFLFLGLIVLITISSSFIEKKYASFKLKNNTKYIVVGHSHPECAFNDSLIPNLKNISQSGESYFYNYLKVKPIIRENPSIDVVFIEFTNNQINESMNEWIWGDKYISKRFPKYSSYMNLDDNLMLFKNNPSAYTNALSLSTRKKNTRIFENDLNFSNKIGGYLYLDRDKTDSIINSMESLKETTSSVLPVKKDISETNLSYLDAIIKFSKKNNKKVFLIRSPQHKKYTGYSNEDKYMKIVKSRYTDIEYLDFSKFPLSNSKYGDLEHLNYKGAKTFSEWFANLLNDGLLVKENKQGYINEKIKARTHNTVYN